MATKILLDTVEKVKNFSNIIHREDLEANLQSGRFVVDAKSIMGIFSLNLSEPLNLVFVSGDEQVIKNFLGEIQEFVA